MMSQHAWDIITSCLFSVILFIFNYFKLFLKMKYDIDNFKGVISEMKALTMEEKRDINTRFNLLEVKIEESKLMIIDAIMNRQISTRKRKTE